MTVTVLPERPVFSILRTAVKFEDLSSTEGGQVQLDTSSLHFGHF